MLMKSSHYDAQRAATRAADAAHAEMMQWYADQLGVELKDSRRAIASLAPSRAKELYKQYQETK